MGNRQFLVLLIADEFTISVQLQKGGLAVVFIGILHPDVSIGSLDDAVQIADLHIGGELKPMFIKAQPLTFNGQSKVYDAFHVICSRVSSHWLLA